MADEQVDREELFDDDGSEEKQQQRELPTRDAIYQDAIYQTINRILYVMWLLTGIVVMSVLFTAATTYYTVNRALDLATERAMAMIIGQEDGDGAFHPGIATSVAQQMEAAMRAQRESLVRELEGMQENHEQALKELLQPVRPAPTRAPQNRPSASDPAGPTPAPPPPPPVAPKRDWSKIGR